MIKYNTTLSFRYNMLNNLLKNEQENKLTQLMLVLHKDADILPSLCDKLAILGYRPIPVEEGIIIVDEYTAENILLRYQTVVKVSESFFQYIFLAERLMLCTYNI